MKVADTLVLCVLVALAWAAAGAVRPGAATPQLGPLEAGAVARTSFSTPALRFEFPGLRVGVAEYDEGPTGATAFLFERPVALAVDVRGGAPGTMNTDVLRLGYETRMMSAVVFAGGSWHGLGAATGAADAVRSTSVRAEARLPLAGVVGAVINDFAGGRRLSGTTPDARLGRTAIETAQAGWFPLGARGAGRFAMIGGALGQLEPSGQGGAVSAIGRTRLAVFTVVNASGFVIDRDGRIARCRSQHFGEPCSSIADLLRRRVDALAAPRPRDRANIPESATEAGTPSTTLTLVVTNQRMTWAALQRLAVQVHTSMARAIQPFATAADGDVLYAATTGEIDNAALGPPALALAASELAWDAVLAALPAQESVGRIAPIQLETPSLRAFVGRYRFGPDAEVNVELASDTLVLTSQRSDILYFAAGRPTRLVPVSFNEFRLDTPRRDRMVFHDGVEGSSRTVVINPGAWEVRGVRLPD